MFRSFGTRVDLGERIRYIWKANIPPGLRELLWKVFVGALPLGSSWKSKRVSGLDFCPCGLVEPLSIFHVFSGCSFFPVARLYDDVLSPALSAAAPDNGGHASVDPSCWYGLWWFPVLCFRPLAYCGSSPRARASLLRSVRAREWIYGSFLWELWRTRLKIAHDPDFSFSYCTLSDLLTSHFSAVCPA